MRMLHELSERDTPLHRLDPRSKLALTLVVVALSLILPSSRLLLVLAAVVMLYGLLATITPLDYRNVIIILIPFSIAITLVQILLAAGNPGPALVSIGGFPIKLEGVERGLVIALRALILGVSFALFMAMTHPMDLTQAAMKAGLPFRYSYMIGFSLRFLPLFVEEFAKIRQAQASRGLDEHRYGPATLVISLPALLFPLIMDALRRAEDIAIALEMRGLSTASVYGRTFLKDVEMRGVDYIVVAGALAVALAALVARLNGTVA